MLPSIDSLHLTYLRHNQKASYTQLCQYLHAKLRSFNLSDVDIEHLLRIKESLSYFIYPAKLDQETAQNNIPVTAVDKICEEIKKSVYKDNLPSYQFLLSHFDDKRRYEWLSWIINEERKKYSFLHSMEAAPVQDLQDLTTMMDYINHMWLSRYRKSCVITKDVDFSHDLSGVQLKIDMCYDSITKHLNNLRHHIYRVDRDSSGMLRVMRSMYDVTERNVELEVSQEIDKCRIRTDYILFLLRQWRAMSQEIKHLFNNDTVMMGKMDNQIESALEYMEQIVKMSFVMTRQPDDINVMQTPSTQRILREREFIKGSFLAFNSGCHHPWITISTPCRMYLVGLNEYKSTDSVYTDFSPNRKTAYDGDLYDSKNVHKSSTNNPQHFVGSDVCFPRVHMINSHLKRRCKEISSSSNKRKHEDLVNCTAAPEEIFSFILQFNITFDVRATWNTFTEDPNSARKELVVQTCSKPVAILVHANQKPQAEGKLFWCRFNLKWHMPLLEESSVTVENFKKTLYEYTSDNFGRELSERELHYLMSQITVDQRQGKLVAKSVLKDEAQYTGTPENPTKRKSFWGWFYDTLVFLGKGKGKPTAKCNTENPIKKHWKEGRICFLSKTQCQDILHKLGSSTRGAIIRVSESISKTLQVMSYDNRWGVSESDGDSLDRYLLNYKFTLIWSEVNGDWIRVDQVCEEQLVIKPEYKPLCYEPPTQGGPLPHPTIPGCLSPCVSPVAASPMSYHSNYPPSPYSIVQGTGNDATNWRPPGTPNTSQDSYISSYSEQSFNDDRKFLINGNENSFNNAYNIRSPAPFNNMGPSTTQPSPNHMFHMMSIGEGEGVTSPRVTSPRVTSPGAQSMIPTSTITASNIAHFNQFS